MSVLKNRIALIKAELDGLAALEDVVGTAEDTERMFQSAFEELLSKYERMLFPEKFIPRVQTESKIDEWKIDEL